MDENIPILPWVKLVFTNIRSFIYNNVASFYLGPDWKRRSYIIAANAHFTTVVNIFWVITGWLKLHNHIEVYVAQMLWSLNFSKSFMWIFKLGIFLLPPYEKGSLEFYLLYIINTAYFDRIFFFTLDIIILLRKSIVVLLFIWSDWGIKNENKFSLPWH